MWQPRRFPLDIDGSFHDSFLYDSTDFLLWLTHLILVHNSTHLSSFLIYPNIHMISQKVFPYCHPFFTLMTPFPVLSHHFSHGCTIVLTEAVHHDSFLTHVLTHIILHAGRIFWQQHRNRIVCLVVESALHVYKGQFIPWFEQFYNSQFRYLRNSLREFSYNKIRQHCFRHCIALTLDLQVWSV